MSATVQGSAEFSDCGRFRHRLDRWWDAGPRALVCGANPSKAGAVEMDPTMHRVVSLCRPHWSGYTMVNASSYIATDPTDHERWQAPAKGLYVGMVTVTAMPTMSARCYAHIAPKRA